jgi:hypothetical protein
MDFQAVGTWREVMLQGCTIRRFSYALALSLLLASPAVCAADEPPTDPELRLQLLARMDEDQRARLSLIDAARKTGMAFERYVEEHPDAPELARMIMVDEDNRQWLEELVDSSGWPGKSRVGVDGAHAAWLLVQHAELEMQQECLKIMTAMPEGEVSAKDLAYLTDRVLVRAGRRQLYGTQLDFKDGQLVLKPVENRGQLDERRRKLGLEPINEYLQSAQKVFGSPPAAKLPARNVATQTVSSRPQRRGVFVSLRRATSLLRPNRSTLPLLKSRRCSMRTVTSGGMASPSLGNFSSKV